jgi:alkylation response protein AidB-like acyl-CoA dehydrogenase
MPSYTAPTDDQIFVLDDVLQVSTAGIPGYEDLDRETLEAILGEAAKLAENVLAPINAAGDTQGCVLENGIVRTPTGFHDAFDQMREGGWTAMDCDPEYGGQGLPYVLATAVGEQFSAANMAPSRPFMPTARTRKRPCICPRWSVANGRAR